MLPSLRRACAALPCLLATAALVPATASATDWLTGGQNLQNSRSQPLETTIGTGNVASLAPKWQFATAGDVSATPAVDATTVYFPDSAGYLYAVDRATGVQKWRADVGAVTGFAGPFGRDYARDTPAISGSTIIVGTQSGKFETTQTPANVSGAYVLGYDKATGALKWKTRIDSHFTAIVTQSAQVFKGIAYVGVASNEEAYANDLFRAEPYTCCSFRGSIAALDVATGAIRWKTYMLPDATGWSGAAVWGSTPAIDQARNTLYTATGNNYSLPQDRYACLAAAGSDDTAKRACLTGDMFDSIVALDLSTGAVRWSYAALASDAWNTDCGLPGFDDTPGDNCPPGTGPDYDFGQGPMLLKAKLNGVQTDVVGAGEKSGEFHLLNRSTGASIWRKQVGPGGVLGGLQWGSSTDGTRIYTAESNSTGFLRGYWSARDPATGNELWRTSDPGTGYAPPYFYGYSLQGPTASANGVVYGCTLSPSGEMVAMDAATGAIKWTYSSGSSCLGGAAIADGTVYWGTGYRAFAPLTTAGHTLSAFTLGGA